VLTEVFKPCEMILVRMRDNNKIQRFHLWFQEFKG
jgi:hypothetical protein